MSNLVVQIPVTFIVLDDANPEVLIGDGAEAVLQALHQNTSNGARKGSVHAHYRLPTKEAVRSALRDAKRRNQRIHVQQEERAGQDVGSDPSTGD